MDAVIIILGVVFSYFVFVSLAVVLAKMIFPKIEIEEDDLLMKEFVMLRKKGRNKAKAFSLNSVSKERVAPGYRVELLHK